MDDKKKSNQKQEIDFTSSPAFQKSVKKAKWKQIILYTIISIITGTLCIAGILNGSQYLINNKIEKDEDTEIPRSFSESPVQGAGITNFSTSYYYSIFSAVAETTYFKRIGDRSIVWDTETKKYPAIGNVEVVNRGSGMVELVGFSEDGQRNARYNQLNNERIIDFYYPSVNYNYLPQELDIAVDLDENKLIEIAISFKEPIERSELGELLGYENVDWLWVNNKKADSIEDGPFPVENGKSAYGFGVSEAYPYGELTKIENDLISGAVISGTPEELKKFKDIKIIRASVIGVTIDKY